MVMGIANIAAAIICPTRQRITLIAFGIGQKQSWITSKGKKGENHDTGRKRQIHCRHG